MDVDPKAFAAIAEAASTAGKSLRALSLVFIFAADQIAAEIRHSGPTSPPHGA